MAKAQSKKITCPVCKRETEWSGQNPHRPFCSDRCRIIDLGDWLSEKNIIPGKESEEES